MKILELTRQFYPSIGGMEKFVADRLKIYKHLGYTYQVVTTTHTERKLSAGKRLDDVEYLPTFTPYEIVPRLGKSLENDYDILSVNKVGYYYSDYAIYKAFEDGKKIILTPHMYFHTNRYKFFKDIHFKIVLPHIINKIDYIICFTKYEANFWYRNFPSLKNKIVIIPHYFNPPKVGCNNCTNGYDNYFLFLGRGEKNKRVDLLIPAFNEIKSNYNLVLTVDKEELSMQNKEIVKQDRRIYVLGRVSEKEKQNLLANCSALVLPSDYEAFGIVLFEASFYKKVLLLSDLEIFKCILDNSGVIYFKNNLTSIKKILSNFILFKEKKKIMMGEKNFNNLLKYDFKTISKSYKKLFEKLS